MSTGLIAEDAVESFFGFVYNTPDSALSRRERGCLAGFIQAWIASGEGIRATNGDFQTYLIAVVCIINRWMQGYLLDYDPRDESPRVERRVDKLLWDGAGFIDRNNTISILDPDFYRAELFEFLHSNK